MFVAVIVGTFQKNTVFKFCTETQVDTYRRQHIRDDFFMRGMEGIVHFVRHGEARSHLINNLILTFVILNQSEISRCARNDNKKARFLRRANIIHLEMELNYACCRLPFHHQNLFVVILQIYTLVIKKQIYFSFLASNPIPRN